jgi:hypothetical protein
MNIIHVLYDIQLIALENWCPLPLLVLDRKLLETLLEWKVTERFSQIVQGEKECCLLEKLTAI